MASGGQAGRWRRASLHLTVIAAALVTVLSACTSGQQSSEDSTGAAASSGASSEQAVAAVPTTEPPPLEFVAETETVFCDGNEHVAGEVSGAIPGERILLASALPIDLAQGVADGQGRYLLRWTCEHSEARLRWDITAIGNDSGRRVALTSSGQTKTQTS